MGIVTSFQGFPCGSDSKETAYNAGDLGLIPGLGRSPGGGNCNPLQYSCPKNSMTPVLLPEEFHGQRSLVGYSLCGHEELDMTEVT